MNRGEGFDNIGTHAGIMLGVEPELGGVGQKVQMQGWDFEGVM